MRLSGRYVGLLDHVLLAIRPGDDQAFLRRLRFLIDFPLPSSADRLRIWRGAFPARKHPSAVHGANPDARAAADDTSAGPGRPDDDAASVPSAAVGTNSDAATQHSARRRAPR